MNLLEQYAKQNENNRQFDLRATEEAHLEDILADIDNEISRRRESMHLKQQPSGPYIETASGKHFYIDQPEFDIEDIIHGLAHTPRFSGHTRKFYSVLEHSMLVAALMEQLHWGNPFEGLMHDAAEAYLVDMPTPWKQVLPDYVKLENRIQEDLREHFCLPRLASNQLKRADAVALFMEAYWLLPSKADHFEDPLGVRAIAHNLARRPYWDGTFNTLREVDVHTTSFRMMFDLMHSMHLLGRWDNV